MIARSPILKVGMTCDATALELTGLFGPTFLTDVVKVNVILAVMIRSTPTWVYMKHKRSIAPNGCRSYRLIFEHFLGPGNMDNLGVNISHCLQHLEWSRDTRTWNWGEYVAAYMAQHNILRD